MFFYINNKIELWLVDCSICFDDCIFLTARLCTLPENLFRSFPHSFAVPSLALSMPALGGWNMRPGSCALFTVAP
jgi:translation initiation factor RLI1